MFCFIADLTVTVGSTISIFFIPVKNSFIFFPAIGAHEPFSMMPTFLFWYIFELMCCKNSRTGVNIPPSYVGDATTILSYLKASSIASVSYTHLDVYKRQVPNLSGDEEAIRLIVRAIQKSGYRTGEHFAVAIDAAAGEMYNEAKAVGEEGQYYFWKQNRMLTREDMVKMWNDYCRKYPILSIEDGMAEDDFEGWEVMTDKLGDKIKLVGDNLFVTDKLRLKKGLDLKIANSIIIKPNQIGTLTETLGTIELAKTNGYTPIISCRSGETGDTTIAAVSYTHLDVYKRQLS